MDGIAMGKVALVAASAGNAAGRTAAGWHPHDAGRPRTDSTRRADQFCRSLDAGFRQGYRRAALLQLDLEPGIAAIGQIGK